MTFWFPKHLARFYLPMPDPIPVVDRWTYILNRTERVKSIVWMRSADTVVEVKSNEWIASLGRDMVVRRPGIQVEPTIVHGMIEDVKHTLRRLEEFDDDFRSQAFLAVIRLWRGQQTSPIDLGFNQATEILKWSQALPNQPEDLNALTPFEASLDYSVAEVVVPLPLNEGKNFRTTVSTAFDNAALIMRHFLESLYMVRYSPLRAPNRETLPNFVPCEIGKVDPTQVNRSFPVASWTMHPFMLHIDTTQKTRAPDLTPEEYGSLSMTLDENMIESIFVAHLRLRRQANIALERHGDYATAVVWTAASAESFFTELLQHLMWERSMTPEKCVADFKNVAITKLLSRPLAERLGGNWNFDEEGPARDWKTSVADLRNRIVHDGYIPTRAESNECLKAMQQILFYITDLLAEKLSVYPRTAFHVITFKGLERRGLDDAFNTIEENIYGPPWIPTFLRWRRAHERLLTTQIEPMESRGQLIFAHGHGNRGFWFLSDSASGQAVPVGIDESSLTQDDLGAIYTLLDDLPNTGGPDIQPYSWLNDHIKYTRLRPPWVEEYQLLPGYGVMVNGLDIKPSRFTWRPTSPRPQPEEVSPQLRKGLAAIVNQGSLRIQKNSDL